MSVRGLFELKPGDGTRSTAVGRRNDGTLYEPQHAHIYHHGYNGHTNSGPSEDGEPHVHQVFAGERFSMSTCDHFHELERD